MRLLVADRPHRVAADRHHHIDDLLAHRRAVDAAAAGDQHVWLERRAAQEMIDAGRQRLDPFQPRRAGEHEILHLDAEHHHDIDIAKIARDFAFVVEELKLQRGKFFAQRIAIHLGMNVDDENFGHERSGSLRQGWREATDQVAEVEPSISRHCCRRCPAAAAPPAARDRELARLLRRLERIIGREHHAVLPSAASVQLSGSAEHMPDVVTTIFCLMYSDGGLASLTP